MVDEPLAFSAEVRAAGNGGHAVVVPAEIVAGLTRARPRVSATVNGTAYESRLAVYNKTCYLGLRKDLLKSIGAAAGDQVEITLTELPEPEAEPEPEVGMPAELTTALDDDHELAAAWLALPDDHQLEYRRWIAAGEDEITRGDRVSRLGRRLRARRP